jgi:ADP-ribose pyrophosphatase YjhB (NUDIX family)
MAPAATVSVDVVILSCRDQRLFVLLEEGAKGGIVSLPWGAPRPQESLEAAASRIARSTLGSAPRWLKQVGAFTEGTGHPGGAALSVCFVAVSPWQDRTLWRDAKATRGLNPRHRHLLLAAQRTAASLIEQTPIAFSLLPKAFTLTELQQTYETLLRRRLHKASFRRSLQGALLVQPTGEWRSEGRGRPAQLFHYAPVRRRQARRGVRLDLP